MMGLPKRRKPLSSGIERAVRRHWPKHEQWCRGFECCVADTGGCLGKIEFAHVRLGGQAGTGIKPPSWQGLPLCSGHHSEQHQIGHSAFDKRYGIDSMKLAAEFANKSTDWQMRDAMRANSEDAA